MAAYLARILPNVEPLTQSMDAAWVNTQFAVVVVAADSHRQEAALKKGRESWVEAVAVVLKRDQKMSPY